MGAEKLFDLSFALQNRCLDKLGTFFLQDNTRDLQVLKRKFQEHKQNQPQLTSNLTSMIDVRASDVEFS